MSFTTCQRCTTNRVVATYTTACGLQLCTTCDIRHTNEHTCRTNPMAAATAWVPFNIEWGR